MVKALTLRGPIPITHHKVFLHSFARKSLDALVGLKLSSSDCIRPIIRQAAWQAPDFELGADE